MSDKPWAIVRDLGALGLRIESTHNSRPVARLLAATLRGYVTVHPTEHAKEMQRRRDEVWVHVFDENGEIRYIRA